MNNNLKKVREEKGLTQLEVAISSNITDRQYRRIEKGEQDPKTKTSILIAKTLNSTVEELFPLSTTKQNIQLDVTTRKEK